MHILHASPAYAPAYELGGPVRSLEGLVTEQLRRGHDVRVLTTDCCGRRAHLAGVSSRRDWNGVPVRYLKAWVAPDHTPMFFPHALLQARAAAIVHILGLFSSASMQALAAAAIMQRPTVLSPRGVLTAHALGSKRTQSKRAWLRTLGPLLHNISVFHATSVEEADGIRSVFPGAVVRVVPNGAALAPWRTILESKRKLSPTIVVGAVGRIHPIKGYDLLIQAAALLNHLEFEVRIVGPTPDTQYRAELGALVAKLELESRVKFVGALDGPALQDFYAGCRLLVLPSHSENFGNVVIEALGAGTPVVASRNTPWEILEKSRCGRWVENTPSALAAAISTYVHDESLARDAGDSGRRLVETRYSWAAVAAEMDEVYSEILGRGGSREAGSRLPGPVAS